MTERWHQFHNGQSPPHFGFGTAAQAQDQWLALYDRGALNTHELTTLDEGQEPPDGAIVVDLNTGDTRPERHSRKGSQFG